MAYTVPANTAVDFALKAYTAPAATALDFALQGALEYVADTFDRADGAVGSNWISTYAAGPVLISSNAAKGFMNESRAAYYDDTFQNDQFSRATLGGSLASTDYWSLGVRQSGGTSLNGYRCSGNNSTWYITRLTGGTGTDIATGSLSFAPGDVLEVRAVGTTISLYKNDALVGSQTDANYTSGAPAIEFYNANVTMTTWDGGTYPRASFGGLPFFMQADFKTGNSLTLAGNLQ
jgi:hypothetical protein